MKQFLAIALIIFLSSCTPTQEVAQKTSNPIAPVPQVTYEKSTAPSGKWTLKSFSSFAPREKGAHYPAYADGDVIWDFGKGDDYGNVIVSKVNPKEENEFSLAPGSYQYWTRQCLIKIGSRIYFCELTGDKLVLNSNTDPSISSDGPVLSFERM